MKNYFEINHKADITGTSFKFEILCPQDWIFDTFGAPTWQSTWREIESESEKVLAEWVFQDSEDPTKVCTLYDWKGSSISNCFHVAAHDFETAHRFEVWLNYLFARENEKKRMRE